MGGGDICFVLHYLPFHFCLPSLHLSFLLPLSSGQAVTIAVSLEREDEEEVSPYVIAPFFPQVRNTIQCINQEFQVKKICYLS